MIELQRNFLSGVMNKDVDPHFLPDGAYQDAWNIVVGDSDGSLVEEQGSHNGVAQNYLGNTLKGSDLNLTNATCIGALSYETDNIIYWLVTSDEQDAIYEYNEDQNITTPVLISVRDLSGNTQLNFNKDFFVTGINYINGLLFWTDNLNPPRRINITRAKNYPINPSTGGSIFTEADINVIVAPPLSSPTIELTNVGESNNLENKFIYFSYRYKYIDNEYSALSPFTPVAFKPKNYSFDYGVSENISMVNRFNTALITFNSGSKDVKEIQLVFRDTASVNSYIIDNLVKKNLSYNDNTEYTYEFRNNKVYTILDPAQITRLFDNVPIRAKSQELIGSRLVYGNYTQFFDLVKCDKTPINPVFSLDYNSVSITANVPKPTFKSNRDYEVGIVYLDDYGRTTTVITPKENTNTKYIPADAASKANNLFVTIGGQYQPPCFATHYRFMIKQDKQEYYNIFPLLYVTDGQFQWFLINQSDVDKVPVGSYVYLKYGSNSNTQYKVLDLVTKNANFLDNGKPQAAGVYFKVKMNSVYLPPVYSYNFSNVTTDNLLLPLTSSIAFADNPIFYGTGNNDLHIGNGNLLEPGITHDVRFTVKIDSASNTGDTFSLYAFHNGNEELVVQRQPIIAGVNQALYFMDGSSTVDVAYIHFDSSTGHTVDNYWTIMCRTAVSSAASGSNAFSSYGPYGAYFRTDGSYAFVTGYGWNPATGFNGDRPIKAGANITIRMKEPSNGDTELTQSFISTSDYKNIEEWFFEDKIYLKWIQYDGIQRIGASSVFFYRINSFTNPIGSTSQWQSSSPTTIGPTLFNSPVYMWIKGSAPGVDITMGASFDFEEALSTTVFETVPTDTNQDIYYELSKTYPIIDGNHCVLDTDVDQNQDIATNTPAIINLNKFDFNSDFNAFSFGNGVESFRIRDDYNSATMQFSPRANSTVEGYEQQTLVQALTYSGVYTQTSAINRLNEFNLSLANFKYLDRFFGSIQKLYSRDTDLVVLQENKVSKVLYGKNLLSDSVGGGTIASIPEVLGTQISYVGEYGISLNPESFSIWGNDLFFTDARRGAVLALQPNGLFEISSDGMKNWFKANLNTDTVKLGMFDPYFEHYTLTIDNDRFVKNCSFDVTPTSLDFGSQENTKTIYIQSNYEWEITVPTNNWLTFSSKFGNGDGVVYIKANQNTSTARTLTINITSCAGNTPLVISQNQAPSFTLTAIQPDCNADITGKLVISSAVNADRYKYCNASTFTCSNTGCYEPDGFIVSGGATIDTGYINGFGSQPFTVRVYNGDDCSDYSDHTVTLNPSTCTNEWYDLAVCGGGSPRYSIAYTPGTFSLNDRVTSGGITYVITNVLNTLPSGSLLTITATGETGCPSGPTYYNVNIFGKRTLGSSRVLYYGLDNPATPLGGDVMMTTGGALMYSFAAPAGTVVTIVTAYSATEATVQHSNSTSGYSTDYAYCTSDVTVVGDTNIYIVADSVEC